MNKNEFPPGWNEARVRRVLAQYEQQTEEQAVAVDEARYEDPEEPMIAVPRELVPIVLEVIARYRKV